MGVNLYMGKYRTYKRFSHYHYAVMKKQKD